MDIDIPLLHARIKNAYRDLQLSDFIVSSSLKNRSRSEIYNFATLVCPELISKICIEIRLVTRKQHYKRLTNHGELL